jgi:hypothetical protein
MFCEVRNIPLISIVIPVFNLEKYLQECLDSILFQEFTDVEVILVNNGSSDLSGEICLWYSRTYKNVRVISLTENHLPGIARNIGARMARGQYLQFCDGDDCYIPGALTGLAELLQRDQPDVCIGAFVCIPEHGAFHTKDVLFLDMKSFPGTSDQVVEYFFHQSYFFPAPWRYLVRRSLLKERAILFPEGLHCEDEVWSPLLLCHATTFVWSSDPFYCYKPRRSGSETSLRDKSVTMSYLRLALHLFGAVASRKFEGVRQEFLLSRIRVLLALFETGCDLLDDQDVKLLSSELEPHRSVICSLTERVHHEFISLVHERGVFSALVAFIDGAKMETLNAAMGFEECAFYIFPTGHAGECVARTLKQSYFRVEGFLDNSAVKLGTRVCDVLVKSPEEIRNMGILNSSQHIVVVTGYKMEMVHSVVLQLLELGLARSQIRLRLF